MPNNLYTFLTEWRVEAPREMVYEILKEGRDYPRWWPDVYLAATHHGSGLSDGIGDRIDFHTRGRLPYRLHWTAEAISHERPHTIEIAATGDFVGNGRWTLSEATTGTDIRFDWVIRAEKPLIRLLSPVLKPIFRWNHEWAMGRGLIRLKAELTRRQNAEKGVSGAPK
ncbi:MAG: SRPBCC family protein [Acidobacteria bacterium]|nr:SRPBCC family protein [Acidobacteriota bacterium]